jgi:hypothetical protein
MEIIVGFFILFENGKRRVDGNKEGIIGEMK